MFNLANGELVEEPDEEEENVRKIFQGLMGRDWSVEDNSDSPVVTEEIITVMPNTEMTNNAFRSPLQELGISDFMISDYTKPAYPDGSSIFGGITRLPDFFEGGPAPLDPGRNPIMPLPLPTPPRSSEDEKSRLSAIFEEIFKNHKDRRDGIWSGPLPINRLPLEEPRDDEETSAIKDIEKILQENGPIGPHNGWEGFGETPIDELELYAENRGPAVQAIEVPEFRSSVLDDAENSAHLINPMSIATTKAIDAGATPDSLFNLVLANS